MATMQVELVSVERPIWSGEATGVFARTVDGELGILPHHAPLLGALEPGRIVRIEREGEDDLRVAVHGGFLSVGKDGVSVLAEMAETADEIDVARARAALDKADPDSPEGAAARDRALAGYAQPANRSDARRSEYGSRAHHRHHRGVCGCCRSRGVRARPGPAAVHAARAGRDPGRAAARRRPRAGSTGSRASPAASCAGTARSGWAPVPNRVLQRRDVTVLSRRAPLQSEQQSLPSTAVVVAVPRRRRRRCRSRSARAPTPASCRGWSRPPRWAEPERVCTQRGRYIGSRGPDSDRGGCKSSLAPRIHAAGAAQRAHAGQS